MLLLAVLTSGVVCYFFLPSLVAIHYDPGTLPIFMLSQRAMFVGLLELDHPNLRLCNDDLFATSVSWESRQLWKQAVASVGVCVDGRHASSRGDIGGSKFERAVQPQTLLSRNHRPTLR
jgi:hypothetical protein